MRWPGRWGIGFGWGVVGIGDLEVGYVDRASPLRPFGPPPPLGGGVGPGLMLAFAGEGDTGFLPRAGEVRRGLSVVDCLPSLIRLSAGASSRNRRWVEGLC